MAQPAPLGHDHTRGLLIGFEDVAFSGSLLDLALGVATGTAGGAVVGALVADLILPVVAAISGVPNDAASVPDVDGAPTTYGHVLTVLVSFLLLAPAITLLVRGERRASGRGAAGEQGNEECDHRKSLMPRDASVRTSGTREVEPLVS